MANRARVASAQLPPLLGGRYSGTLAGVVLVGVFFTLTDLLTSYIALNEGFSEGNSLVTGLASSTNLGVIESLLATKSIFIFGMSALAFVGLKSSERTTKKIMLASTTVFMVVFALVSINNLYWILS